MACACPRLFLWVSVRFPRCVRRVPVCSRVCAALIDWRPVPPIVARSVYLFAVMRVCLRLQAACCGFDVRRTYIFVFVCVCVCVMWWLA